MNKVQLPRAYSENQKNVHASRIAKLISRVKVKSCGSASILFFEFPELCTKPGILLCKNEHIFISPILKLNCYVIFIF